MVSIPEIEDPEQRFLAFIKERENIRRQRELGLSPPWTEDPYLQAYRFTNVNRENDKVSKHYQKTVRDRYGENSLVFPATVLYRWYNRISTCDALFNEPDFTNSSIFEAYMMEYDYQILYSCLEKLPAPIVTGAFIINGMPGYEKWEGVLRYFHDFVQRPWQDQWGAWRTCSDSPYLQEVYDWLRSVSGLGSFMRAQIVADLKYLPFLREAPDWWTWAAPGPGSMKGLNIVMGLPMKSPWNEKTWLTALCHLSARVQLPLEGMGIGKLHNQDLQNCLCEFSKYTKVSTGVGRPRQVFRHV